jgi:2-polyprenyl-3-methyl-5-hydroxy-6-metoxy-1,4-benzoquinol methylase
VKEVLVVDQRTHPAHTAELAASREAGPNVHQDLERIGIVVVAYNAASTLAATLNRIPGDFRRRISEVLILDDASSDGTAAAAQLWAEGVLDHGSVVVKHSKNLGYGGNQKAAYELAAARGLDVVVLLHGDGQYAPELLPQMVAPILEDRADAVFGSRMMTPGAAKRGGMPLYKRLGNRVLTTMENRLLGTGLSEFHSGYRAYRLSALREIPLQYNHDGFDFDTQIIIQLVDAGKRIVEIPIPTYYGDEICYVDGVEYAWNVTKDVLVYRLSKMGFGTSRWVPRPTEYDFKEGDGSSHTVLLDMAGDVSAGKVLDLGCSGGLLSEQLRRLGHYVVGADVVEVPGVRARVDEFHRLDLATANLRPLGTDFDVIVLGDVIEHLPEPAAFLDRVGALLRPGGQILVSVPNVGHWYPRARVALGLFGYDRRGILDSTHLRFFTRRSLRRLVNSAGFDVVEERHTGLPLGLVADASDGRSPVRAVDALLVKARPELFAYQFVLRLIAHRQSSVISVFERNATIDGSAPLG